YALEEITQLRWGATRHIQSGIETRITYTIGFGNDARASVVEVDDEHVFDAFVTRLYRAVGPRLISEMFESLREDRPIQVGGVLLGATGVTLPHRTPLFGKPPQEFRWDQLRLWTSNGAFHIEG